jgi:hypothetical protein
MRYPKFSTEQKQGISATQEGKKYHLAEAQRREGYGVLSKFGVSFVPSRSVMGDSTEYAVLSYQNSAPPRLCERLFEEYV